ncbi:MAG TPA: GntR family transcriptional regulator [Gemmatimonadales bacterium]|jgi:GntR family transcriptional regulator|nr:GntR family transcriptional regulator [Gemmatimonadales bacterium]
MFEQLDPRSPTPLYAQIAERLRVAIVTRELAPAEMLPSVRQLAASLRVNPATVVQAYRALENEGFIEMRQGMGTYVREVSPHQRSTERERQATELVRRLLSDAARLGLSAREVTSAFERELGETVR